MHGRKFQIMVVCKADWRGNSSFRSENKQLCFPAKDEGTEYNHGMGIIKAESMANYIFGYSPTKDRVMNMNFKGKPYNVSVLVSYASTIVANEEELEQFMWLS